MNIKEHIEAGHYPVDDKGRPLVPLRNGDMATIYTTEHSPGYPIVGGYFSGRSNTSVISWSEDGEHLVSHNQPSSVDILPPPPRKEKVERYTVFYYAPDGRRCESGPYQDRSTAERCVKCLNGQVVTLTGEYEEPWA